MDLASNTNYPLRSHLLFQIWKLRSHFQSFVSQFNHLSKIYIFYDRNTLYKYYSKNYTQKLYLVICDRKCVVAIDWIVVKEEECNPIMNG